MSGLTAENLWRIVETLRGADSPTVHCITNYVAANDCANALLAVGAIPVMADCGLETAQITESAQALSLNMGVFSPERGEAMLTSGRAANARGIPIVLDPVGAQASELRRNWFLKLAEELRLTALKGNFREIEAAAGLGGSGESPSYIVKSAAERFGCAVMITGETDYISDGGRIAAIRGGTPLLSAVTGTGCMTGVLAAAFCCASEGFEACAAAVGLMNVCGELAAERFHGTASFRVGLIDSLSQVTRGEFLRRINITEI